MIMQDIIAAMTAAGLALVIYHHLLFPLILKRVSGKAAEEDEEIGKINLPEVTVVIPAHNEEAVIADKVRNLAALDYPGDRLKVIVACDGCTDGTADEARRAWAEPECLHLDLNVLEFMENRGKVAVLNNVIPLLRTEIIALSDASALISLDAMRIAAHRFTDPAVGVVAGTYHLLQPGSPGEAAYWRYQQAVKRGEAALGSPMGAHGALYFFRRELFRPLPADTINDDFILPMEMVACGAGAVYEPAIIACEMECADEGLDHHRRRRIAAGNLQQTIRLRRLLHPRHGGVAFVFASGKALRAVMPFLLLLVFLGSLALAPFNAFFAVMLAGQCLGYGIALYRQVVLPRPVPAFVSTIHYLVAGHVAGLIGSLRYMLGLERGRWFRATHDQGGKK